MTARQIKAFCSRSLHLNGLHSAINTAGSHLRKTFAPVFFCWFVLFCCVFNPFALRYWSLSIMPCDPGLYHCTPMVQRPPLQTWEKQKRSMILKVNCNIHNLLYKRPHTVRHVCHVESPPLFSGVSMRKMWQVGFGKYGDIHLKQ